MPEANSANSASRPTAPVCLALTGASGMPYGLRLLECLLDAGRHVQLVYSPTARIVARQETDVTLPEEAADAQRQLRAHFAELPGW